MALKFWGRGVSFLCLGPRIKTKVSKNSVLE